MQTLVFQLPGLCPYPLCRRGSSGLPYARPLPAGCSPCLPLLMFTPLERNGKASLYDVSLLTHATCPFSVPPPTPAGICLSLHPLSNGRVDLRLQLRHHPGQGWAVTVPQLSRPQKAAFLHGQFQKHLLYWFSLNLSPLPGAP